MRFNKVSLSKNPSINFLFSAGSLLFAVLFGFFFFNSGGEWFKFDFFEEFFQIPFVIFTIEFLIFYLYGCYTLALRRKKSGVAGVIVGIVFLLITQLIWNKINDYQERKEELERKMSYAVYVEKLAKESGFNQEEIEDMLAVIDDPFVYRVNKFNENEAYAYAAVCDHDIFCGSPYIYNVKNVSDRWIVVDKK